MKQLFLESHNLKNKFSGFGQFNYHFIKALAKQDLSGLQITLNTNDITPLKETFGTIFKYHKYKSITRHKPFRIKKKYDLWHCLNQNIKVEPFYDIPYVLTVHDVHFTTEGSKQTQKLLKSKFEKKMKRASAITYISEFTKRDTHQHFKVPNVPEYVIYNGNTITEITIPENYTPKVVPQKPYLFSIGDFTERKNFKSLVKMLPYMEEYQLILAGNNTSIYAEELLQLLTTLQLQDRVLLTGKINDMERNYYLKNCEAFVFPSLREGFGIPPIEAMRFGKPVFLSNNTSLPEIGGEKSFYWENFEPKYMATVIKEGMSTFMLNKKEYETWYIERAQSFNWEQTAQKYLEIYKNILSHV